MKWIEKIDYKNFKIAHIVCDFELIDSIKKQLKKSFKENFSLNKEFNRGLTFNLKLKGKKTENFMMGVEKKTFEIVEYYNELFKPSVEFESGHLSYTNLDRQYLLTNLRKFCYDNCDVIVFWGSQNSNVFETWLRCKPTNDDDDNLAKFIVKAKKWSKKFDLKKAKRILETDIEKHVLKRAFVFRLKQFVLLNNERRERREK